MTFIPSEMYVPCDFSLVPLSPDIIVEQGIMGQDCNNDHILHVFHGFNSFKFDKWGKKLILF